MNITQNRDENIMLITLIVYKLSNLISLIATLTDCGSVHFGFFGGSFPGASWNIF